MSDFDSGSSRKGFVRDVMRRISSSAPRGGDEPDGSPERGRSFQEELDDIRDALRLFGPDSPEFRRRLDRMLAEYEALRRRYQLTREQFSDAERQNERLVNVLQEAKQQIELLKEEVDKLCAPPNNYGIFNRANKDGTAEIFVDGRQMRVNVHPNLDAFTFEEGQLVVLNEAFNVVEGAGYVPRGEIASVVDLLADNRAIVLGHTDDERVVTLSEPLRSEKLKVGDHVLFAPWNTSTHVPAAAGGLLLVAESPAVAEARIACFLPSDAPARLDILDVRGRRIRALRTQIAPGGRGELAWDGRDERGRPVAHSQIATAKIALIQAWIWPWV